jgi:hypothetical protein
MKHPPKTGTPLPDAAESWESDGDSAIAQPTMVPTLHLVPPKGGAVNNRREARLDDKRAQLRDMVATVDREIARRSRAEAGDGDADGLIASWDALVKFLALGPAPQTRECPACGRTAILEATRCGYCWASLQPTTPLAADAGSQENL